MRVPAALAAGAAALAIAAWGGDPASGDESPIKVGAWFQLSGPVAASGIPQEQGASAAFKQVNADGGINGRDVEFVARDNAFDPQQTIQVARRLIGSDHVVAIVGANGTATTAAAFPYVLDQAKVPIVNPYGGAADWYHPPKPLLYGYQVLYERQAAAVGAWAAEGGAKRIVVLRSDPAAFANVAKQVAPAVKAVDPGAQVEEVVAKFQSTDYGPIVGRVKAAKPDAVVTILAFPEAAAYLKQARLQGLTAPVYGYAPDSDEGLIKLAGDAAEGFHAVSLTKPALDPSPEMQTYRAALQKYAPGERPSSNSAAAYAGALAFAEVLKKIKGEVTPRSIADAFASAGTVETGVLPPLTWSRGSHLGTDQLQRVTVKDGRFVAEGGFVAAPSGAAAVHAERAPREASSADELVLSLIAGLSNGAIYGLVGLGLVIIYRSTGVVNFAIGTIALACMYLASSLNRAGLPLALAVFAGIVACVLAGVGTRETLIRPLPSGARFSALVITMGLALIVEELTRQIWGGEPRTFPALVGGSVTIAGTAYETQQLLAIPVAAVAMLTVAYLFKRTPLGAAMRAAAESSATATALGIDPDRVARVGWGLGMGLAALGAALIAPATGLAIGGFAAILFRSFAGIFLGGLTSMFGAVIGGVLVGVLDSLAATYVSASLRDTFVFSLVILVLLVRPQGIFGEPSFARV